MLAAVHLLSSVATAVSARSVTHSSFSDSSSIVVRRRSCSIMAAFDWAVRVAVVCALVGGSSAVPEIWGKGKQSVECERLSATFCDPQFGCRVNVDRVCAFDASLPRDVINCTSAMIDAGTAVANAQLGLTAAFASVRIVNWGVMQNTSAIMDILKDASYKFDIAVKAYNASLIKYNTAMFLLEQYQDALDALTKTCSITVPPPPPTCPAQILDLQTKVAKANATAATLWIQVVLSKSMMDIAAAPVDAAEAAVKAATTTAALRYAEISKAITAATTAKDNAMTYWQQVVTACSAPAQLAEAEEKEDDTFDLHKFLFH